VALLLPAELQRGGRAKAEFGHGGTA
jgi:hypothetical protein